MDFICSRMNMGRKSKKEKGKARALNPGLIL